MALMSSTAFVPKKPKALSFVVDDIALVRKITRASFFEFVCEFWDEICPSRKLVLNWHIEYLCNELQIAAERVFADEPKEYDLIVNVPPGTTKSSIFSIAFCPWTWTRMPNARHINVSHTDQLVLDLSRKSRDVVKSEKYAACFPEIQLRDDQDTKGYWANTLGGDRFSCTVGGKSPTGMHGHFINIDDPIDPKKALSELELKASHVFLDEVIPDRKVDKEVSFTALVMQRLHKYDPAGYLLERALADPKSNKVRHICLPCQLTDRVSPRYLRQRYKDGLLDPKRLSQAVIDEAYARGQYPFAGQWLQDPIPLGGGMFKIDKVETVNQAPALSDHEIVRYWDKAATPGDGCYSVGVKMAQKMEGKFKRFFVLDVVRGQWSSDVREAIIKRTAQSDGKGVQVIIEQEPGSGGKESAESTVKNLPGFRVRKDKPTGDKIFRADPYSVQVNEGNVTLVAGAWNRPYLDELQNFSPASPFKDQVDASSGAFAHLCKNKLRAGGAW